MTRSSRTFSYLLLLVVVGWFLPLVATATDPACITDSTENRDAAGAQHIILIKSAPCGVYGTAKSRFERVNGVETQVTVPYMKHEPAGNVKAIAVLFAGGDGNANIVPDPCGSATPPCDPIPVQSTSNNFLVRSAQLFAERGFRALTIDRPSPAPDPSEFLFYDNYRLSMQHALDIAAVVRKENPNRRPVFLVGTSRGAESAVAQNLMVIGSMLSSPVTLAETGSIPSPCDGNHRAYVDDCFYTELQPAFVDVPVQILGHLQDGCFVSPPAQAMIVRNNFVNAGVQTFFRQVSGGFAKDASDPCEAQSFHGFLGIENATVDRIARRMTRILQAITTQFGIDTSPVSDNATRALDTTVQTSRNVNLSNLASDADGDPLTFTLPHPKSARGASLSLAGSVVTYDTAGAGFTGPTVNDAFVYVTSDGKGRKSFGIVKVTVTTP